MVSAFAGEAESATTAGAMSAIVVSILSHGRRDMRCSFLTKEKSGQGARRHAVAGRVMLLVPGGVPPREHRYLLRSGHP
ncbi:hypothetical protein Hesp01_70120 [Herbidospora sp. NBRC 101105]|nr:hypothetical protein Hesp01_70120 [Herbidospora sp. NBRC 101105]